jgi:hypothetical protein
MVGFTCSILSVLAISFVTSVTMYTWLLGSFCTSWTVFVWSIGVYIYRRGIYPYGLGPSIVSQTTIGASDATQSLPR